MALLSPGISLSRSVQIAKERYWPVTKGKNRYKPRSKLLQSAVLVTLISVTETDNCEYAWQTKRLRRLYVSFYKIRARRGQNKWSYSQNKFL